MISSLYGGDSLLMSIKWKCGL